MKKNASQISRSLTDLKKKIFLNNQTATIKTDRVRRSPHVTSVIQFYYFRSISLAITIFTNKLITDSGFLVKCRFFTINNVECSGTLNIETQSLFVFFANCQEFDFQFNVGKANEFLL